MRRFVQHRLVSALLFYGIVVVAVCGPFVAASCATARHVAVVGDVTFSTVLFAIDDAQWQACHPEPRDFQPEQCARLDRVIKKALLDGQALTLALQTSRDGVVTASLADVIQDLNLFQQILAEVGQGPTFTDLSAKVSAAITKVTTLLRQIVGG